MKIKLLVKIKIKLLVKLKNINKSIIELDSYLAELCDYGSKIEKLNKIQKIFYFNQCLEGEINNGGFNQYFTNSAGNFSHETVESLLEISAEKTAFILQNAINQFPGKVVPKNRDERISVVEVIEEEANVVWSQLDQDFYKYEDDLSELNFEFIKKNKIV